MEIELSRAPIRLPRLNDDEAVAATLPAPLVTVAFTVNHGQRHIAVLRVVALGAHRHRDVRTQQRQTVRFFVNVSFSATVITSRGRPHHTLAHRLRGAGQLPQLVDTGLQSGAKSRDREFRVGARRPHVVGHEPVNQTGEQWRCLDPIKSTCFVEPLAANVARQLRNGNGGPH